MRCRFEQHADQCGDIQQSPASHPIADRDACVDAQIESFAAADIPDIAAHVFLQDRIIYRGAGKPDCGSHAARDDQARAAILQPIRLRTRWFDVRMKKKGMLESLYVNRCIQ